MNMTPEVSCKYGAPMGRRSHHPGIIAEVDTGKSVYLQRIPLDNGGYDKGGAYWGTGQRLYGYVAYDLDGDELQGWVRADNREHAKEKVREEFGEYGEGLRFFN